jgi:hypothetical protein
VLCWDYEFEYESLLDNTNGVFDLVDDHDFDYSSRSDDTGEIFNLFENYNLKLSSSNNFFDVYDFDNVSLLDDDSASL